MVLDPETIAGVRSAHPEDLGRAYLDRARQHAGGDAPIFVDKFPLNFLAGHIARACPTPASSACDAIRSMRCGATTEPLRHHLALLRLVV
jgi:hypothetical protein